jgi:hypothetical protein
MNILAPASMILGMALASCGTPCTSIVYPGRKKPLGYVTIPTSWHKVPLASGGRTANLFVPKSLGMEVAENETRPAISVDLIGIPDSAFKGPYDQEYWISRHIADVRHHEASDLQSVKLRSVDNPQLGKIDVYRLHGDSRGESLMAAVVGTHGWYLVELRAANSKSFNEYQEAFFQFLGSLKLELGNPRHPTAISRQIEFGLPSRRGCAQTFAII